MRAFLEGLKKILNPVADALHCRGALDSSFAYLMENLFMMWVILACTALFLIVLVVIIVLSVKAHRRNKAIRRAEDYPQIAHTPVPVSTAPTPTPVAEEPTPVETTQPVEEPVAIVAEPAPVAEEPVAEEEPVVEEEPVAEEKPAPVVKEPTISPAPVKKTAKKKATPVAAETAAAVATEDSAEEKKQTKYRGKWTICKLTTQTENDENKEVMYFFELHASNGEKLMESQEYTSLAGAKKGIETHVNNIQSGNFKISLTKKGTYIFKLMNAKGMLLCTGENYTTRARCEKAIESTKRFAETAVIDETVQEIVIKVPADEENTVATATTEGAIGKWIVSKETDSEGNVAYYFELFANNGEKLLSSEDYASPNGAISGLETHKKNIEKGNFRIVPTKRGDYIFKLLNGNNQLLCLGEHYKTRRLCQNAVESVKRFALSSPTVNDVE